MSDDLFSRVLHAYAGYSFTRLPEPEPKRRSNPLRVNGYPEAKRAERRAKNKAARKARRKR